MSDKRKDDLSSNTISRRGFLKTAAGGAAAVGLSSMPFATSCSQAQASTNKKVIVLGLDGMDPKILRMLIERGRLPNFKRLAEMGYLGDLTTTVPALSPVAWSSFITGLNPGGHGIADFVMRDPDTYKPVFSIYETRDVDFSLELGDVQVPLAGGGMYNLRKGEPFWSYLTEAGIPAIVTKMPTNFPAENTATQAVSGMGTAAVTDTYGLFTYYTTNYMEEYPNVSGGDVHHVDRKDWVVETTLYGPDNAYVKPKDTHEDPYINKTKIPLKIYSDPSNSIVRLEIQGKTIVLNKGEYSDWVELQFDMHPLLGGVSGIARFLVKEVHPHLKLYVTPININPLDPAAPVSYPEEYSKELAGAIGPFWTKGLPADTKAFDHKILNDEEYVKQAQLILQERLAMFDYEFSRFAVQKGGFFFFYVSNTDQDAHMLWRNMDPTHPLHDQADKRFADYLFYLYEEMDKLVGKVMPALDDDTLLMICSDHGFAPFGKQFHLNSWLRQQGYLTVKDSARSKPSTSISDIDWSKTIAYGSGFNGLLINLKGRERDGIIPPEQAEKHIRKISSELMKVTDPEGGMSPVSRVYRREEVYSGEYAANMPEMLVGYTPGYRNSSNSVLGKTGSKIIELNPYAWSGDHSMAREFVPGTLLTSRKISKANPNILDLPVTILEFFGLAKPEQMVGKSIFKA